MRRRDISRRVIISGCAVGAMLLALPAVAQEGPTLKLDVAAQNLGDTLREVAKAANFEFIVDAAKIRGKNAPALHGTFSIEAALEALLVDTSLVADVSDGAIVLRERNAEPELESSVETTPPKPKIAQ